MFHNDILLVDLEMSSDDPNTCDLVEIGAVLLDNRTLEIQDEYNSLIKPEMGEWTSKAEQVHGRKRDYLLKVGRDCKSVISEFEKVFDLNNVRLACWNIYDVEILRRLLKTGINNTHKIFELWSYTYPYLLLQGITPSKENVHGLNYFLERFHISRTEPHDALSDARAEAEVFKRITKFYLNEFSFRLVNTE